METVEQSPSGLRRFYTNNRVPILVFAITRLGLFVLMYLSLVFWSVKSDPDYWRAMPDNLLLDGWSRWDSAWFGDVALHGYDVTPSTNEATRNQMNVVMFPGYPVLLRAGMMVFGNIHVSGIIVSNVSYLVALILLYHLVMIDFGDEIAKRTIILLSVFPMSFFFSAVYSESLFLLSAVAAFYFGRRGNWSLAGISCALATATRLPGVVLPFGLAALYLEQIDFKWSAVRADILWLLVGYAGVAGYFGYLWLHFGFSPADYLNMQIEGWQYGHAFTELATALKNLTLDRALRGEFPAMYCIHVPPMGAALVLALYAIRRVRLSYGLWALASLLVIVSGVFAFSRYAMVIFPLFIALAMLLRKQLAFQAVVYVSTLLLGLFAVMFSHWYWVA